MDITKEARRKRDLEEAARLKEVTKDKLQANSMEGGTRSGGQPIQSKSQLNSSHGKGRSPATGDWNSVETPEDSIGESPVQIGGERRRWQNFTAHHDLEDSWIAASSRKAPTSQDIRRNTATKRKGTYFKFNTDALKESEVKEKMIQL
ncbi:hypothetical protein R1sor_012440 [Riccia sorocarpa]|uniref:Uncharacterized protein n=1 Tax=Riccia sorocarpa TaxID=122646 RepID=A0ABD3I5N0_9MARC